MAFAGFGLSAAAHVVTFFGIVPRWLWLADIGASILFVIGLAASLRVFKETSHGEFGRKVFRRVPIWMAKSFFGLFAYVVVNFLIVVFYLNEGGVPSRDDNGFVLRDHGRVIRRLSEADYHLHKCYTARLSSEHDMLFYCFSGLMLCAARRPIKPAPT